MHVFKNLAHCQTHTTSKSARAMRVESGKEWPKIIQKFNDRTSFFPPKELPGNSTKVVTAYSGIQILASKYRHFTNI